MITLPNELVRYRHPLEAIPRFRNIPPSLARDLLYTLLLCMAVTLAFSLITLMNVPTQNLTMLLYRNFVYSLAIGYSIHLLSYGVYKTLTTTLGERAQRYTVTAGVLSSAAGGVFGFVIASLIVGSRIRMWTGMLIAVGWICALLAGMAIVQRRRMVAELAYERERNARVEAERLMTASRLKLLQAQIEPHFLFNTLAGVSSLIEADPASARKMVDQLCIFLRAALDSTRRATASLQREFEVIDAYLSVMKVRMGARLSYRIDASPELLELEVPSMILQPLVENAIEHGIDSKLNGGEVLIQAIRRERALVLTVSDNGDGFKATAKDNIGMGTVRERLEVLFGAQAALRVEHDNGWTRVIVELPCNV